MGRVITAREGYVLLEDVTIKYKGVRNFNEIRHKQPQLAVIREFTKPVKENEFMAWDDKIEVGQVVLKPVTQKYEFDDGNGGKLLVCHHSDIKVFFGRLEDA